MVSLLAKVFIKNRDDIGSAAVRQAYGTLCGVVGIVLNLLLCAGKLFVGSISGSIAVIGDALNSLSDAGSSVVTLIGFKLAAKKPDPQHPFGHGRMEYLSGLAVSMFIVLMGVELGKSSVDKILHPSPVTFNLLSAAILVASILVKVYMSYYNRAIGKRIDSSAMCATAADSLSDSVATGVVLLSALVGHFFELHIDGIVGAVAACFILWAGIKTALETIDPLLGRAPEESFVQEIEAVVMAHEPICGIHDLIVHDYGPGRRIISLHAEVPAERDVLELHDVIDNAELALSARLNCEAVIHMDPVITSDERVRALREQVTALVQAIDPQLTLHDFRVVFGTTHTNVIFDVVAPFRFRLTDEQIVERIRADVRALGDTYRAVVKVDKAYVK
ncbi:MAG: cation transporter [Oscillospiraceae bacterium]|nr:cation transporter [Oscillospiraceae bacterium]